MLNYLLGEKGEADNEEWIEVARTHVQNCARAGKHLLLFPPLMRPLANLLLPSTRRVRSQYYQLKRIVEHKLCDQTLPKEQEKPNDFCRVTSCLESARKHAEASRKPQSYDLVHSQLYLMAISIHTTSSLLTTIMLDFLHHEEYIGVVRDEIQHVIQSTEHVQSRSQLQQLRTMDSFMKESQRLSGTNFCKYSPFLLSVPSH